MKLKKILLSVLLVLVLTTIACGNGASLPTSSDLFVVVGNYSSHFAGNGNGDGLLLDQFAKENKVNLYVQVANDREMKDFKDQMVNNVEGSPDILITDDSLLADNLQNVKFIASHLVGIAIRNDVASELGLQGNTISFTDYVQYSKSGQLLVVGSNALAGFDSAEFFFSVMAWCSNTDASNLTADIIQQEYVRECGKDVYDSIKSTNGSNEAINLVYNTALNGDVNGYNSVIAFDSALMGNDGLNARLAGKNFFKFYYFEEATAKTKVAIGTKDFSGDPAKNDLSKLLVEYLLTDNSQKEINLAGFTEGSSALVEHYGSAFKSEWGVSSNPSGVQIVNPPISNVANNALEIYRLIYKRLVELNIYIDVSGSTVDALNNIKVVLPVGFKVEDANKYCGINQSIAQSWKDSGQLKDNSTLTYEITRLQAMTCAIETYSNPEWLKANGVELGQNDRINYYFFTDTVTKTPVASSTGQDISTVSNQVISLIGPAHEPLNLDQISRNLSQFNVATNEPLDRSFVAFGGTWMFDSVKNGIDTMLPQYDPNVDYIYVILTDGENNVEATTNADSFYSYWKGLNKPNIVLMGIQFGGTPNPFSGEINSDVSPAYTQQFGGNSFSGTNNDELLKAFKFILGN